MFKGLAKTFGMSGGRRKTRKGRGRKTRGGRRRVDVKSMTRKFSKPEVAQKPKLASWKTGPRVTGKLAEKGKIFGLEKKAPPTAPKPKHRPRPSPRPAPRPIPAPRPTQTKHQGCPDGVTMTTKEFDEDKHANAINLYKQQTGVAEALSKVDKTDPFSGRPMGFINEATPGFRAYIKEECPILIPPTPNDPCSLITQKEKCQAVGADATARNCKCSWLVDNTLPSNKRCKTRKTPGTCI